MAEFKKLHLNTAPALAAFDLSLHHDADDHQRAQRMCPVSSEHYQEMQQRNNDSIGGSTSSTSSSLVASPVTTGNGALSMDKGYFDKKDNLLAARPTSNLIEHHPFVGEPSTQNSTSSSSSSSSTAWNAAVEAPTRKFSGPSMTQQVANASATALRSRHGSDADRLVYNPITGIPFRGNSPDRTNPAVQARLARSPFLKPFADPTVEVANSDSAVALHHINSPRSTPARAALSRIEYQPLSSDEDDESAIHIMSQSEPGFARQDFMERSMSFHLRRRASGRRPSRRSSSRSFSSSGPLSPAASFLAGFNRDAAAAAAASPDSEGQEIGDRVHGRYVIGPEIGRGGFSTVKEAQTMSQGEKIQRAVKILPKQPMGVPEDDNPKIQLQFEHERVMWSYLPKDEPSILPLIAVFDTEFAAFCITRKLPGGSLQDLIRRNRRASTASIASTASGMSSFGNARGISFDLARRYIFQLATALRCLHEDLSIVHRDVKLENCLLDNLTTEFDQDSGSMILCDFGMADFISPEDRERYCPEGSHGNPEQSSPQNSSPPREGKFVGPAASSARLGQQADVGVPGSLPYASPELLQTNQPIFHPSIDMWAFGVSCYAMLAGRLPFSHHLAALQREQIIKGEWSEEILLAALEDGVHAEPVLELIRGCLHMDPEQRWTVSRVLSCEFLASDPSLAAPNKM